MGIIFKSFRTSGSWGVGVECPWTFQKQRKFKRHGSIFSKWAIGGLLASMNWLHLSRYYEINSHLLVIPVHQKMPVTMEIFVLGTVSAVRDKRDRCGLLKYNLCWTLMNEDILVFWNIELPKYFVWGRIWNKHFIYFLL